MIAKAMFLFLAKSSHLLFAQLYEYGTLLKSNYVHLKYAMFEEQLNAKYEYFPLAPRMDWYVKVFFQYSAYICSMTAQIQLFGKLLFD